MAVRLNRLNFRFDSVLTTLIMCSFRFNETKELSARYLKFNLRKLLEAAVESVGNGATSCTTRVFL
jgi:hypothetical protein